MLRFLSRRLCAATVPVAELTPAAAPSPPPPASPDALTPRQIVDLLNAHIVGQDKAKRAVAVALRNRWRRKNIDDKDLRDDVTPKNILMIGPTGVGKTEIARRMAKITNAPFIKVEATKYTEVGVKGKDVDSIIEDLYANASSKARSALERDRDAEATGSARDFVYTYLARNVDDFKSNLISMEQFVEILNRNDNDADAAFWNREITMSVTQSEAGGPSDATKGGVPLGGGFLVIGFPGGDVKKTTVTVKVREALALAKKEAFIKLIDDTQIAGKAKQLCETDGIVVIDEIDKIVADPRISTSSSTDEAVQQDLLPIIEGSIVTMKDGTQIDTQGILFICCGAFHMVKPADMIAELQGRLPVRVDLQAMTKEELKRVLTEPKFNLIQQQIALLKTDKIDLVVEASAIEAIAEVAATVNKQAQNTGARRLGTVVERVLDEVSFDVEKYRETQVVIDAAWVKRVSEPMIANIDLAKYLL